VTISGSGFTYATAVNFGGTPATSFYIASDSSIVATAPPGSAATVDVTVTNADGSVSARTAADQYTYTASLAPAVTGVSPNTGSIGGNAHVTITGSGFTGASSVMFGTVEASSFIVNSDTSITAVNPPEPAGTVDVIVTTPMGTSATSTADQYTYAGPVNPPITSVTPNTGGTAGGTWVSIIGSEFTGARAVYFGSIPAYFRVNSDDCISAIAPAQAPNPLTVDITVQSYGGTSAITPADQFTYFVVPPPSVTSVAPTSGQTSGGTQVMITGSNFTGATAVNFGTTHATSFTLISDTSIEAIAPPGSGTVDVTVVSPTGTSATSSADQFTYNPIFVPTVTSIGQNTTGSDGGGTPVMVFGTGFTTATGVYFGGVPASVFGVSSDSLILALSPPHPDGVVDITVSNPNGTSAVSSADQFTYTQGSAPVVTALFQPSGPTSGGTDVTIEGTGFTPASSVLFGTVPAASFYVESDTTISAVSPAHAAGTVDVTVTSPSGTSATGTADHFTYYVPATLTTIYTYGPFSITAGNGWGGQLAPNGFSGSPS
jgi:hypothetical protein